MSDRANHSKSLEQLDGEIWPQPPEDATSMVKNIHELRRRPIGTLEPHELARLIGQNIGLVWLLPLAVETLQEAAPGQAQGGFFDEDLLYAAVTRSPDVWKKTPELARELKSTLTKMTELSPYSEREVNQFLASIPGDG